MTASHIKALLMLLIVLCSCAPSSAQYVPAWEQFTQCGPGGCAPRIWRPCPPAPQYEPEYQPDYEPYEPEEPEAPFEPRPPQTNPNQEQPPPALPPAEPSIDRAAFADWQKKQDQRDEKSLLVLNDIKIAIEKQGGCKCEPCDLGPVNERLAAMAEANAAVVAAIGELKSAIGGITIPPLPTPQPEEGEQHVVVVADQNAPYWQRLAEQINRTKQTYHGIQVAGLPKFPIGVHPQAVVYRNSVPVRLVKGQYEVEALLSRLARGEAI